MRLRPVFTALLGLCCWVLTVSVGPTPILPTGRVLINDGWRFIKGDPPNTAAIPADAAKSWVLPTGNPFLKDPNKRARRPEGNLGDNLAYAAEGFDDSSWREVNLPHDYAIEGPFTTTVSGSTGRLPSSGIAWYRKILTIPASDAGKSISSPFFLILTGPCRTAWSG